MSSLNPAVISGIFNATASMICIAYGPKSSTMLIFRSLIADWNRASAPCNVPVAVASIASSAPVELSIAPASSSHADAEPFTPSFTPSSK